MKRASKNVYHLCHPEAVNFITALVSSAFLKMCQDFSLVVWLSLEENRDNYILTYEEKYQMPATHVCRHGGAQRAVL